MAKPLQVDEVWQARIAEQINGLQFGQVLVTVHDGQIVQIDRTERTRYQLTSNKDSNFEDRTVTFPNKQDSDKKSRNSKSQ
ncbi:MAG: YezD family protein [Candidatus Pristimantibacillus lignocellulolyticus]|uniref:YezD family protein n=1 Tax=Candidatus Pristimantibacillus lignocellulolyticus TaxID=2994561 RepID=A0A9J6ZFD5_9BACL|nr:MAG: YezD family protein [Candidatus Pristimantibacillus lignocellulolyticus]